MKSSRNWTGIVLLFMAASLGFALVLLPGTVADQYERIAEFSQTWANIYLGAVLTGAVLFFGATTGIVWRLWIRSRRKKQRKIERDRNPSEMSSDQKRAEISDNLASARELTADDQVAPELRHELAPLLDQLEEKQETAQLEIVAFGTVSSGKSAVLNLLAGRQVFRSDARAGTTINRSDVPWPGDDRVSLVDTPGLGEIDGAEHVTISAAAARDADLILLVIDGPLRQHEAELLTKLAEMEKPVIVCLNKSDWYGKEDADKLEQQLRDQLDGSVDPSNFVLIQATESKRTRMRLQSNGEEIEEEVVEPANIEPLSQRMLSLVCSDAKALLLANLLMRSRGMLEQARETVKQSLDKRAWSIVDRYMWGAGGAAAVSPLPVVDLVAGSAISTKMVVELAKVYRQEIDLDSAVSLMGQLGKNLIGILGATAATPAVTSLFASMLKTVPGVGTIAGGMLQGVVQALITRWIGAVFIEYFRNEMQQPEGGLASIARRQWQQMTTVAELRKLVQKARKELGTGVDTE